MAVFATDKRRSVSVGTIRSTLESNVSSVTSNALWYPSTRTNGWRPFSRRRPASRMSSLATIKQPVTPSPQAFSWDSANWTKAFAAGCFTRSSATIFAPSFVTAVWPLVLYIILSKPFGPKVPRKRSPKATAAPTSFCVTATPLVTDVVGRTMATGARPEPSLS